MALEHKLSDFRKDLEEIKKANDSTDSFWNTKFIPYQDDENDEEDNQEVYDEYYDENENVFSIKAYELTSYEELQKDFFMAYCLKEITFNELFEVKADFFDLLDTPYNFSNYYNIFEKLNTNKKRLNNFDNNINNFLLTYFNEETALNYYSTFNEYAGVDLVLKKDINNNKLIKSLKKQNISKKNLYDLVDINSNHLIEERKANNLEYDFSEWIYFEYKKRIFFSGISSYDIISETDIKNIFYAGKEYLLFYNDIISVLKMDNHPLFVDYPKLKRLDQVFNKDLDNYDFMFAYVNYPKELENKIKKVIKTEKFF